MKPSDLYAGALDYAVVIVAEFQKKHGREPTEAERSIASSLFIDVTKNARMDRVAAERSGRSGASGGTNGAGGGSTPVWAPYGCPECGYEKVYDNRASKKSPSYPDFKCANTDCTGGSEGRPWAAWLTGKNRKTGATFSRSIESVFKVDDETPPEEAFSDEALQAPDHDDGLPF